MKIIQIYSGSVYAVLYSVCKDLTLAYVWAFYLLKALEVKTV